MNKKYFISTGIVLLLMMLIVSCDETSGNESPAETFIEINTAAGLDAVRNDTAGNYILTADIDLSGAWAEGEGWVPIGDPYPEKGFTGTFDGNGHTITGLTINRPAAQYQGLFGYLGNGAIVKDLNIVGGSVHGSGSVGGLAGIMTGESTERDEVPGLPAATVENCYVSINVSCPAGNVDAGCLVGSNYGNITRCHTDGSATGGACIAGLAGMNGGDISRCYSTADASGSNRIGGLAGQSFGNISNCYSTGSATATDYQAGGLLGLGTSTCYVSKCYSTGTASSGEASTTGGLAGWKEGPVITSSYCLQAPSAEGIGVQKTEAELKLQATFTDWNFTSVWKIDPAVNSGYPSLRN